MKFCRNCGKQLEDSDIYCPSCGTKCEVDENTDDLNYLKQYNNNQSSNYSNEVQGSNGMAIAGLICAFFIPKLGWIFGGIGLPKSKQLNGKGYGMSIAAIIIATLNFLLTLYLYASGQLNFMF